MFSIIGQVDANASWISFPFLEIARSFVYILVSLEIIQQGKDRLTILGTDSKHWVVVMMLCMNHDHIKALAHWPDPSPDKHKY